MLRHTCSPVVGAKCDSPALSGGGIQCSIPVWPADEAATVAYGLRGPAAGDATAENRGAQHSAFETGAPVDVAAGHARDLPGGIEPTDRCKLLVKHPALEIGLHAAEVLARKGEHLHGVVGRRVERF